VNRRAALLAVALGIALAASGVAATARADTFRVLAAVPSTLPGADVPNAPGSILFPASLSTPPAQPQELARDRLESLWKGAGAVYGIPWQVLAAINEVESNFGRNMGPSSAGAIGWMQFMPSTWERWGVDADGDGVANPWSAEDAIYAAARYLAASGGQDDIARAVFSYNHAQWYVDEVLGLAKLFHDSGTTITFRLDRLQQRLQSASAKVIDANRALIRAQARERVLTALQERLARRAATVPLLSEQLTAQKRAVLAGVRREQASADVARLQTVLDAAQQELDSARAASAQAATAAPATAPVLASASFGSGYVFPVGGGPSRVLVSHTHHDYPAADIAAPAGSPVYALANAVVERGWHFPVGLCGIGMTLKTADGQVWTYCHLAVLDPRVVPGAVLAAGDPVGLVGSTGHATGPHLHLQLQPPTEWPQQQAWFASFAGSAFSWSDAPTPAEAAPRTVFSGAPKAGDGVVSFTR
jgi:murein DD-endopeptidase MepM/ murein hydrolase activator NlpD